jgi:hypothetical protein
MNSEIWLAPVINDLPQGIDILRAEATCEGLPFSGAARDRVDVV